MIDDLNECYNTCKRQLCRDKDCNECYNLKNKEINNENCEKELAEIIRIREELNQKYKNKCKFFIDDTVKLSDEINCDNLFENKFISESKSNSIIYTIFKRLDVPETEISAVNTEYIDKVNKLISSLNK